MNWYKKAQTDPIILYHGTWGDFDQFDIEQFGTIQKGDWGKGIYFTRSKYQADSYRIDAIKRTDEKLQQLHKEYNELERNLPPVSEVNSTPAYDEKTINKLRELQEYAKELNNTKKGRVIKVMLSPNAKIMKFNSAPGMTDPSLAQEAKDKGYDVVLVDEGKYIEEWVVVNPNVIQILPDSAQPKQGRVKTEMKIFNMDWYKQAQSIEFDSSEGIHEVEMGPAKLIYQVLQDGTVSLASLRVPQRYRRQGYAKAILSEFTQWLDREGLQSTLGASPLDKKTHPGMLEQMYSRFGYKPTGKYVNPVRDKEMRRSPQEDNNELV